MKVLHAVEIQTVDGFDVDRHKHGALFYIGLPLDDVQLNNDVLAMMGAIKIKATPRTLEYQGQIVDWVDAEWFYSGNINDIYNVICTNALTYSLCVADFKSINLYGWLLSGHISRDSKPLFSGVTPAPLGLGTGNPEPYVFQGFTGTDWDDQVFGISLHTSPYKPFLEKLYCKCDLEVRTAATAYLVKLPDGNYAFGINGEVAVCRSDKDDLAGYIISAADVEFLRHSDARYQFKVALIAREYRNQYDDDISVDILTTIIQSPDLVAVRLGFTDRLNDILNHFAEVLKAE